MKNFNRVSIREKQAGELVLRSCSEKARSAWNEWIPDHYFLAVVDNDIVIYIRGEYQPYAVFSGSISFATAEYDLNRWLEEYADDIIDMGY